VTAGGCAGIASAPSREKFKINGTNGAMNGRSSAHELGHLLHFNAFEQDGLSFDTSLNGAGHNRGAAEFESSASVEGGQTS